MRLGGIREVARELGVNRSEAMRIKREEGFPSAIGEADGRLIWDLDDVEQWMTRRASVEVDLMDFSHRFEWQDEELGHGGKGTVYRGVDRSTGSAVAVKVINTGVRLREDDISRFYREISISEDLRHSNVVRVLASGKDEMDRPCFAMELANGTLSDFMDDSTQAPSLEEVGEILTQICAGVTYLHSRENPILHRDIKPANILRIVGENGSDRWVVSDLGLASRVDGNTRLVTRVGQGMGTEYFSAPEQERDAYDVDLRSDIYSLGRVLQYLVIGEVPRESNIPDGALKPVIRKATSWVAEDRYDSVDDFIGAVNEALAKIDEADSAKRSAEQLEDAIDSLPRKISHADAEVIIDWLNSLDFTKSEAQDKVVEVLTGASGRSLSTLFTLDSEVVNEASQRYFGRVAEFNRYDFEYCDDIATFAKRVSQVDIEAATLEELVYGLGRMAANYTRFAARRAFGDILRGLDSNMQVNAAIEGLDRIPSRDLEWLTEELNIRAFDRRVRVAISARAN